MISAATVIIICAVLIVLNALFAGAEIAVVSANKTLVRKRAGEESLVARLLEQFHEKPQIILGSYIIGTTICTVAASTLAAFYLSGKYGETGEVYAIVIMTPLLLVLAEMAPKIAFQERANSLAGNSLVGLWAASRVFYPLVWLLGLIAEAASRLTGGRAGEAEPFFSKSELEYMLVEHRDREALAPHEQKMIRRIFRFSETTVDEVMIPLVDVKAVEENAVVRQALDVAARWTYSRYPVFSERVDNIVGTIKTTELLAAPDKNQKVAALVKPVLFVPETMHVDELLARMQRENFLMAAVVDEYGGVIGIVTREDILEEVIGDIRDEHEPEKHLYRQIAANRWMIDARMEIDQINEVFRWNLPKDDYETLSGFLLDRFQRIPKIGEIIRFENFTFLVKRANPRAILEVMVYREEPEPGSETKPEIEEPE
jgi:putative hemolysin